ncbi:TIGR00268 family protein [Desulfuribacillus stibiiarsenatis]|uniref:TIGR00268 family protein n=1 Tax=Desulfuribacillus stibiiarsenatis TaxID=1390249 RepID=A0A1E5L8M6_9FIRM|nr:ATP-dependent sacrificial sulfur transferase LarE [Desulfuribacillus stibiiarsenatis]OEH86495.1 TIGR00268 family protein [Desulfuribacillus stibiiarsenatis]
MNLHPDLQDKLQVLDQLLISMNRIMISFSGGVDSTFLLARAKHVLSDRVLAVTAASETFPQKEVDSAVQLAKSFSVRHIVTQIEELRNANFVNNDTDRCYHCKTGLFTHLLDIAKLEHISTICDGSNYDDLSDYRPGFKALHNLSIRSPLLEAKLTKEEIRLISKEMGLPTWNKPSFACLSSRIPYGTKITLEKITQIEEAEEFLKSMGILQIRVRHHDAIARIEVYPKDFPIILENYHEISDALRGLGFHYVTLDLQGYQTGSMNRRITATNTNS